jgi:hypothetical protein
MNSEYENQIEDLKHQLQLVLSEFRLPRNPPVNDTIENDITNDITNDTTNRSPILPGKISSEQRIINRMNYNQHRLMQELEEQALSFGLLVGCFSVLLIYVIYHIMETLLKRYRCKCPNLQGWENVVKSAKLNIQKEHSRVALEQQQVLAVPAL